MSERKEVQFGLPLSKKAVNPDTKMIKVTSKTHYLIKRQAADKGMTMTDYLAWLIELNEPKDPSAYIA